MHRLRFVAALPALTLLCVLAHGAHAEVSELRM